MLSPYLHSDHLFWWCLWGRNRGLRSWAMTSACHHSIDRYIPYTPTYYHLRTSCRDVFSTHNNTKALLQLKVSDCRSLFLSRDDAIPIWFVVSLSHDSQYVFAFRFPFLSDPCHAIFWGLQIFSSFSVPQMTYLYRKPITNRKYILFMPR